MIHIVLCEPEIPANTGNVMRTCVATNSILHLIKPLGFSLEDKHLRRSGVNYIDKLEYYVYESFDEFKAKNQGKYYFASRYGKRPHSDFDFSKQEEDIYLIFGKESNGISKEILKKHLNSCMRIPMADKVRALNLSNCVALVLYEVLRQQNYPNLFFEETQKDKNYLEMD